MPTGAFSVDEFTILWYNFIKRANGAFCFATNWMKTPQAAERRNLYDSV